jgi:hypothetical protein
MNLHYFKIPQILYHSYISYHQSETLAHEIEEFTNYMYKEKVIPEYIYTHMSEIGG